MNTALVILTVLGVMFIIISTTKYFTDEYKEALMLGCGLGILFSIVIICPIHISSISPIDVYRGKTTLQITYKDSIPIDSAVVYKNK